MYFLVLGVWLRLAAIATNILAKIQMTARYALPTIYSVSNAIQPIVIDVMSTTTPVMPPA